MYIRAPQPPAFAYYQPALLAHVRAQHHKPLQVQIYRPVAYFAPAGKCAYRPPEAPQQRPQHEYTRSYLLADALRHYAALDLCRVNMARAQGINTGRAKVVGLMLSNGLVALSGALLTQYQGYADVSMGRGAIVIGLAAVIIGEVLFGKIFRNFATKLIAVSIGAIIYYIVMQVVLWLGLPTNYLKLLTALVVAMFLAVPHWKSQLFTARSARKGEKQDA